MPISPPFKNIGSSVIHRDLFTQQGEAFGAVWQRNSLCGTPFSVTRAPDVDTMETEHGVTEVVSAVGRFIYHSKENFIAPGRVSEVDLIIPIVIPQMPFLHGRRGRLGATWEIHDCGEFLTCRHATGG